MVLDCHLLYTSVKKEAFSRHIRPCYDGPVSVDLRRRYGRASWWKRWVFWVLCLVAWGLALDLLGAKGTPWWSIPFLAAEVVAYVYAEAHRMRWAQREDSN